MLTENNDSVVMAFKTRLTDALTEVNYNGPMTAQELDLPNDLVTSLIELVFGILSGCIGASKEKNPEEIAERVQRMNVIQQMHFNNQVRKQIFNGNRRNYIQAGGPRLSDAAITAIENSNEIELASLIDYVKNGTDGLTQYPEL